MSFELMRMNLMVFLLLAGIASVFGDGKFAVITHPDHVKFVNTKQRLDSIEIPFLITNLFGLPSSYELKWGGLLEGNPFLKPKALALFSVYYKDNDDFKFTDAQKSYQTNKKAWGLDEEFVSSVIQEVDWEKEPLLIETSFQKQLLDIKSTSESASLTLSLDKVLEEMKSSGWLEKHGIERLNVTSDDDLSLLSELYGISKVIEMLQKQSEMTKHPSPDFYYFKVEGLRLLSDESKASEAWKVLETVISETTAALKELYENNVVVAAVAMSAEPGYYESGRHLQMEMEKEVDIRSELNYATVHEPYYAETFNIILWVSVAFALVMGGVAWGMWHMDPGRDSVIYRMTTQRLKRD